MFVPLRRRDFDFTDELMTVGVWTSVAPSIAALVANLFVVTCAVAIYCNLKTRRLLSRQSLTMLLSVQLVAVFYDAGFIVGESLRAPTRWCDASVTFGFLAENYMNFVVTLIAVNLQLTIVYHVQTVHWTKYYIGGSFLASLAIMLPGAVNDVWGWDPIGEECWTRLQDPNERFFWQMLTNNIWAFLCTTVSLVATVHVLLCVSAGRKLIHRLFKGNGSMMVAREDHLVRRVAMRIVWYPIILIVCNTFELVGELTENKDGSIGSLTTYTFYVLDGIAYALLPLLLAIVAVFVDPTFTKAMRVLFLRVPLSPPPSSGEPAGAGVRSTLLFTPAASPSDASAISHELTVLKVSPVRDGDRNPRRGKVDAGADEECGSLKARADAEMPGFDLVSAPANLGAGGAEGTEAPAPLQGRLRARAATYRMNLDAL